MTKRCPFCTTFDRSDKVGEVQSLRELAVHVVIAHGEEFHELAETVSSEWDGRFAGSRPATDRLRDALDALVVGGPIDNDRYIDDPTYHAIVDVWRRAARPATDPAGLDVEAVAAALHETAPGNHNIGEGPLRAICDSVDSHRPRAELILATLSVADGPGPEDEWFGQSLGVPDPRLERRPR